MARQSYFKVSAKAENRITVMFVIAESLKINNALPNGRSYQRMDAGTSTVKKMGETMLIHRIAIDEKGYFLEVCNEELIRLVPCKCESEAKLG
jgi:hypothetical protein